MRLISLARIAAEAEGVRLRAMARRQAMRGVWGAVAAFFGLLVVLLLHVAAVVFLALAVGFGFAALIMAGVDALLLAVFAMMALRSSPGRDEREAQAISQQARAQLASSATTLASSAEKGGAGRSRRRSLRSGWPADGSGGRCRVRQGRGLRPLTPLGALPPVGIRGRSPWPILTGD
jgi:uncharacterized membrane protein YgcG